MGSPTVLEVLLVEDDPGDVLMTREALQRQVFANRLHVVNDGVAALRFLRRENGYADARRPDIILLDLNLPLRDGRQVLADVKSDPDLAKIPVVVLTTSSADEDVERVYGLHANAFVTKPGDFDDFVAAVSGIDSFFTDIARVPRNG